MSDPGSGAAVAGIVTGVLGRRPGAPSPDSSVVELGATSLDANRIAARIAAELGVRIRVATVLASTVPQLAAAVEQGLRERGTGAATPRQEADGAPLTPAQAGIWMAQRIERDPTMYAEPVLVRLEPAPSRGQVIEAVRIVAGLHGALLGRVRPRSAGSPPVLEESAAEPEIVLRPLGASGRLVAELEGAPIDVTRGPLCRFVLFGDPDHVGELGIVVHHLVCDGAGLHRLLGDLAAVLAARAPAAPGRLRFSDYLRMKRDAPADPVRVRGLAQRLEASLPPAEPPRGSRTAPAAGTAGTWGRVAIDDALLAAAGAAAGRAGCTTFAAVGAAFTAAIGERCGVRDIPLCVGASEQHDRAEFAGVVGHYINLVPVPVDAGAGGPEGLARAAEAIGRAQADRDVHVSEVMAAMTGQGRGMGPLVRFVVTTGPSFRDLVEPPVAAIRAVDTGHAKVPVLLTLVEDGGDGEAAIELSARRSVLSSDDAALLLDDTRRNLRRFAASF
jgi:Condensation domain/Phosphopantetheine attachment site